MVQSKMCPVCKKLKRNPRNKTCGDPHCKGKYADTTKNRTERQKAAEAFIRSCMKAAGAQVQLKTCVVCGDFLEASLATHHFDKEKAPMDTVTLCGSCHRIFDSSDTGLQELEIRRKRYYKHNLRMVRLLT